jgi:uncharacterized protein YlzI (FlbEa/FlbD family)
MTTKRKKEIIEAIADGKKVYLNRMILNSPNFEKPEQIKKVFRQTITTMSGNKYKLMDGDQIVINHHS